MSKSTHVAWPVVWLAFVLGAVGTALAAAKDVRHIKVVSIEGNTVVVWDQFGAQEYTVPESFRFTVDGKELAAADLEAGMQGTADVANATAVKPVHITEIKMGKVVSQVGRSVTVKDENGQIHRFTQREADERGVRFYMDSKPTRISQLQPGDELSVTIVSVEPPEILTAEDVATAIEGEETAATAAAETSAAPPAAEPADAEPGTEMDRRQQLWLWLLAAVVLVGVIWLFSRNRPKPGPKVTK